MSLGLLEAGLILAALFTSALSGVAGLGGGTVLIALLFAAGLAPAEAVPLFAAVQFVANLSRTAAYARHVEWRATGWFLLAAVPATWLIAPYAVAVNPHVIALVLAGLILVSLLPAAEAAPLPARLAFVLAGAVNGALGLFVGATGLFVGRLFLRPEWRQQTTIGTLALTQTFGHGLRVLAFGAVGYSAFAQPLLLAGLAVAVITGTVIGKRLNDRLDPRQFRRLLQGVLLLLSLKLIADALQGLGLW